MTNSMVFNDIDANNYCLEYYEHFNKFPKVINVAKDVFITPKAKEYLAKRRIKVVRVEGNDGTKR